MSRPFRDVEAVQIIYLWLESNGPSTTKDLKDIITRSGHQLTQFQAIMKKVGEESRKRPGAHSSWEWFLPIPDSRTKNFLDKSDILGYDEIEEKEPTP